MRPGIVSSLIIATLWIAWFPLMLAAQQQPAACGADSIAIVDSNLPNGLYLVQRWTTQKEDLVPLLAGEIFIEHDPRQIEPESTEPILYVTVAESDRVLFEQFRSLDPVAQEDGRINLQIKLAEDASEHLEELSRKYLGRQVATVIGGRAITLHKVRSIIRNGQLQITRCTDDGCRVILQQLTGDK